MVALCWLAACLGAAQDVNDAPADRGREILASLRPGHPRLMLGDGELAELRARIVEDAFARDWAEKLRSAANAILDQPPVEHELIGPRLLDKSRRCLDRVYVLGLSYRLWGDERYSARAIRELLAAAAFPDWNPSHFLDTAEMSHAFAIGYDWLQGAFTDEQRATVRTALIEKGLKVAEAQYRHQPPAWWSRCNHNWNQVCNGGIGIGALAVADEAPDLAVYLLGTATDSIRIAMREYGPDGGWAEGPGYWHYATSYNVYLLAALESAVGSDLGLPDIPGFAEAGQFRLYFAGPRGKTFNYADASEGEGAASEMLWLARRFGRPEYAAEARIAAARPDALGLIWYREVGPEPGAAGVPLDAAFHGVNVAFFRSAWSDPDAVYLAAKGGDNRANHSHLDLGSFVLDALGVRWATDLGPDDYNLPGYFGNQRFGYFRLRTESHNTLTLGGANQPTTAKAPLVAFESTPTRAGAVFDLSAAYAPNVTAALRGVALLNRRDVLIQDEVTLAEPAEIVWTMLTRTQVNVTGNVASLSAGDARLCVRLLEPADAYWETMPASPAPPEAQQPDATRLVLRRSAAAGPLRIAVLMTPYRGEVPAVGDVQLVGLGEWPGRL
jgi:hypothetical protein